MDTRIEMWSVYSRTGGGGGGCDKSGCVLPYCSSISNRLARLLERASLKTRAPPQHKDWLAHETYQRFFRLGSPWGIQDYLLMQLPLHWTGREEHVHPV